MKYSIFSFLLILSFCINAELFYSNLVIYYIIDVNNFLSVKLIHLLLSPDCNILKSSAKPRRESRATVYYHHFIYSEIARKSLFVQTLQKQILRNWRCWAKEVKRDSPLCQSSCC